MTFGLRRSSARLTSVRPSYVVVVVSLYALLLANLLAVGISAQGALPLYQKPTLGDPGKR